MHTRVVSPLVAGTTTWNTPHEKWSTRVYFVRGAGVTSEQIDPLREGAAKFKILFLRDLESAEDKIQILNLVE
jgi:hypothetical protein